MGSPDVQKVGYTDSSWLGGFIDSNNDAFLSGGFPTTEIDVRKTVSGKLPENAANGDKASIYFSITGTGDGSLYEWQYQYFENAPSDGTIKIYVNSTQVYPDSDPVIVNDRTLVPIRVVAEALGYHVEWDAQNRTVDINNGSRSLLVPIGSNTIDRYFYDSNGSISKKDYVWADVEARIMNDRTYLPLRAVGEALGAKVEWDGNTRSVFIFW